MADWRTTVKDTLAGGFGGTCLVIVGHPLDTLKVRIQTMIVIPGQPPPYTGAFDCALRTIKNEGFFALYKGMLAPLTGITPMYSLCFLGYSVGRDYIFCRENSYRDLELVRIGLAGATSGLFTSPILAPLERAKCLLQVQGQKLKATPANATENVTRFKGPLDVYRHLYKTEKNIFKGISSIFRGYWATNLRDCVASFFYFTTYEIMKAKWAPFMKSLFPRWWGDQVTPGTLGTLIAGGTAGIFNWLGCIPIDTMKSQLQTAPEGKYKYGLRSVFAETIRTLGWKKGILSTYRGIGPIMVRAFPANAACFYGYETAKNFLNSVWK